MQYFSDLAAVDAHSRAVDAPNQGAICDVIAYGEFDMSGAVRNWFRASVGLEPLAEEFNEDRDKFVAWLEDPLLLQKAVESKDVLKRSCKCLHSPSCSNRQGVLASIGVFEWSLQTGSVCSQLTRRALATLIETWPISTVSNGQNATFVWGLAPDKEIKIFLEKAKADMRQKTAVCDDDSRDDHRTAEFDALIAWLSLPQDQHSKDSVAALRMRIEGGLAKAKIAELLTGKRSSDQCDRLLRNGRRVIWYASLVKAIDELDVPDTFLTAIRQLSEEEIKGPQNVLSFHICSLVHEGAIDEVFAERIIRLAVEVPELLYLLSLKAGCPLSLERPSLERQTASDHLPEPLGFSVNPALAQAWVLQETMPPDVKLVLLCLASIAETGKALRIATGLSFRRWEIACKVIREKGLLARLESVAGNT